jgi:hypothetical protein
MGIEFQLYQVPRLKFATEPMFAVGAFVGRKSKITANVLDSTAEARAAKSAAAVLFWVPLQRPGQVSKVGQGLGSVSRVSYAAIARCHISA